MLLGDLDTTKLYKRLKISKSHFPWPVKTQMCEEEEIYFLKHVFFIFTFAKTSEIKYNVRDNFRAFRKQ